MIQRKSRESVTRLLKKKNQNQQQHTKATKAKLKQHQQQQHLCLSNEVY